MEIKLNMHIISTCFSSIYWLPCAFCKEAYQCSLQNQYIMKLCKRSVNENHDCTYVEVFAYDVNHGVFVAKGKQSIQVPNGWLPGGKKTRSVFSEPDKQGVVNLTLSPPLSLPPSLCLSLSLIYVN
jgi:hypothetical protein